MSRYSRHIVLSEIGQKGKNKITQAKVLVVGAGGLGCPALQYLTAAGIGTIGIIDFDIVEESNLQRQVLFGTSSLGINKALAAKTRLEDLNPTITIHAYPEQLTAKNAIALFNLYDIIVDGTDNFATRYLINDASIIADKPLVYGAIYKFEGQVSVFNYNNGPCYRCLFPLPPKEGAVPNCSEIGVLGVLPGIIGTMQANEVIKIILGFDNVLSGKLFFYNAVTTETYAISINRSDAEITKVLAKKDSFQNNINYSYCKNEVREISADSALQKDSVQFVDVREPYEKPPLDLCHLIQIPLEQLEQNIDQLNPETDIILICQSGVRSKTAVTLLQEHNIKNCYSLKGGALALIEHLKINI